MSEVLQRWEDPEYSGDPLAIQDWRTGVYKNLKNGDVKGVRKAALPSIQAEVVRIALEGKSEQTRLSAAQFVLGQEGEGAVTKVEGTMMFERMPADQLQALIASKIEDIKALSPNFDVTKLMPTIINGEKVYVAENKIPDPEDIFEESSLEDEGGLE